MVSSGYFSNLAIAYFIEWTKAILKELTSQYITYRAFIQNE